MLSGQEQQTYASIMQLAMMSQSSIPWQMRAQMTPPYLPQQMPSYAQLFQAVQHLAALNQQYLSLNLNFNSNQTQLQQNIKQEPITEKEEVKTTNNKVINQKDNYIQSPSESELSGVKTKPKRFIAVQDRRETSESLVIAKKISKNIPKNIFKGLIKYILGKKAEVATYLGDEEEVSKLMSTVKKSKNSVLTLYQLKQFLQSQESEKYSRIIRMLSYRFFSKDFVSYIYNSKIKCKKEHMAYKPKFIKMMKNED